MKFVTFQRASGDPEPGVLLEEQVISLRKAGFIDLISVLAGGAGVRAEIDRFVASPPPSALTEFSGVELVAPIPRPGKVICVGLNYHDHLAASGFEMLDVPTIFSKFSSSVVGPGQNIILPKNSSQPDYEAELAFIIGVGGRHIPAERWTDHVFGYCNFNDVSARDYQMATTQWLMGKTFDTFAPLGPYLVSADEIPDPHSLDIRCEINGETLQESNTRELIFKIPYLVEHLSSVFTLEPGDVVATGTPAGIGVARKPPRFLKPGDEVVVSIEGLGELRNPVVAEDSMEYSRGSRHDGAKREPRFRSAPV